ncbi:MAG: hypothetical protein ABUL44_03025, partial [Flavobacterium sp.]
KTKGRTLLHCAIYPNTSFYRSILNCSASGKKRGGDYHVVKAFLPIGFCDLIPPFVLSKLFLPFQYKFIEL